MNEEFLGALSEIVKEKGISVEALLETIDDAIIAAYKKNFSNSGTTAQNVKVKRDEKSGEIHVYAQKVVVEEVYDDVTEISLEDAKAISAIYQLDDIVEIEVTPKNFGRIAAQTAKQVVVQRIRESEREIVYNEFIEKENEIVTGEVARANKNVVYVNLGRIEGIMTQSEQIPLEVKKTNKGPQIVVSRSHPGLVKRLFEEEVPEIYEGIVQIKSVAREAGSRTKMAVRSIDEKIDPIGACVGPKGLRVKNIVDELGDEKIDIIKYSEDPAEFISAALSPSKVVRVDIDEDEKSALVIVPDYQLSLAIGKEGQNARLAAKLTNWKIDIKSESQAEQEMLNLENSKEIEAEDVEAEFIDQEELDTSEDNFSEEE